MKLRNQLFLAAAGVVLVPLLGYMLFDSFVTRSLLIEDAARSLRYTSHALLAGIKNCPENCEKEASEILVHFARTNPDFEVLLVDPDCNVVAATDPERLNQRWWEPGLAEVARGERSEDQQIMEHNGIPVLDVSLPWRDVEGEQLGAIHLAYDLSTIDDRVAAIRVRHLLFVLGAVALVTLLLVAVVHRLVVRRVLLLDRELSRETGQADKPQNKSGGDELERATEAIRAVVQALARTSEELRETLVERDALLVEVQEHNVRLAEDVQSAREDLGAARIRLDRAGRLAVLGELAAGLAHDIRNPLFIVRGTAQSLRRQAPEHSERAAEIIDEADRIEQIIAQLLDLSRPIDVAQRPIESEELLAGVVARAERAAASVGGALRFEINDAPGVVFCGDLTYLAQALSHLLDNARDAMSGRGTIRISSRCTDDERAEITIADEGPGIPQDDLPRLFEPFFSRKAGGTGLGLCAAQKIVELHGGTIRAENASGRGAIFRVRLPLSCPDSATRGCNKE